MAEQKKRAFRTDERELADFAKALSHPVRVRILSILGGKNVCICGEIVDLLPLSQSTVSQHLKELKRVGLVRGEIEGPRTCYCLDRTVLEWARARFETLFASLVHTERPLRRKRNA
jgi:DNA-binding transcriptional ArsR family regulator